ncbi:MAG: radical SAM protein, partial [Ferruginibacter sp.]
MGLESFHDCPPEVLKTSEPSASHRNTYYDIGTGVFLVPGINKAAICDTNTGNVYSINSTGKEILLGSRSGEKYKEQLQENGLFQREATKIEQKKGDFGLNFVWFEILSDDCNERCTHCYADSMPPTYRKYIGLEDISILEKGPPTKKLTAKDWEEAITKSYELGARNCQFIGGEPFLWKGEDNKDVLSLARHAKEVGFKMVEIFTNATLILERDIPRIQELGLNIAVSLYSNEEEVHDQVTRTPGSFKKTLKTLERLKLCGVPTRVETVLMKQNEHTIENTNKMIEDMGFSHRPPDVLRPKGRGDDPAIQPSDKSLVQNGLMLGPNFSAE